MRADYLTEAGARQIQTSMEQYWRGQGYAGIRTWTERRMMKLSHTAKLEAVYFVRSNIKNGFPPKQEMAA